MTKSCCTPMSTDRQGGQPIPTPRTVGSDRSCVPVYCTHMPQTSEPYLREEQKPSNAQLRVHHHHRLKTHQIVADIAIVSSARFAVSGHWFRGAALSSSVPERTPVAEKVRQMRQTTGSWGKQATHMCHRCRCSRSTSPVVKKKELSAHLRIQGHHSPTREEVSLKR